MQRKRHSINHGFGPDSPGDDVNLHGIPTMRMGKKSLVATRDIFYGKIVNSANVTWWTSRNRALRTVISTRSSQEFMVPSGGIKRSSKTVIVRSSRKMTPYGEMQRYPEKTQSSASELDIYQPTSVVWWRSPHCRSGERRNRIRASHVVMTPLSRLARYPQQSFRRFSYLSFISLLLFGLIFSNSVFFNNEHVSALESDTSISAADQNSDSDYSMMPLAASAGISISGDAVDKQVKLAPGDIGYREHTISIDASDISNYTLTISGPTNLTGPSGATTISGANNKKPTGTGSEAMLDNTWGYGWGDIGASKEDLYYQSLSSSGTSLASGNIATTGANAGKLTLSKKLAFAVKFAANNDNYGQYKANVLLSFAATPATATYTLSYNANGGSNAPTSQTCTANGVAGTSCSLILSSNKPTRTNYTFLGWGTSNTATSASYQPGASITLTGSKTLYAVWEKIIVYGQWRMSDATEVSYDNATTIKNSGITNMQQMTSSICNQVSTPAAGASTVPTMILKDSRDSNYYMIAKYADGRCWMTSNLLLEGPRNLTSGDSDVSSSFTLPTTLTVLSSANDFSSDDSHAITSYVANRADSGTTVYYTWTAATAGADKTGAITSGSMDTSICPKGWKLPSGYRSGEYGILADAESITSDDAGSTKLQGAPYNFRYTGMAAHGAFNFGNSQGNWWTSTTYSPGLALVASVYDTGVEPGTSAGYWRSTGMAVRCIARNS